MIQRRRRYLRSLATTVALTLVAIGCSSTDSDSSPVTTKITPDSVTLTLTPALSGLDQPTAFAAIPDTEFMLVAERTGKVWVLRTTSTGLAKVGDPLIDLSDSVITDGSEQGLLGLAVSGFGSQVITNSVERPPAGSGDADNGSTTIRSFSIDSERVGAGPMTAADSKVLLTVAQPYQNHNGGQVLFGPDAMLYIGFGDGGSGGDPQNRAQDLSELLGKIVRIDPRVGATAGSSTNPVPADNPFVSTPGARSEIWASGVRNPWRFDIDSDTGDLWVADVGQEDREEITRLAGPGLPAVGGKGSNLGWPLLEGTLDGGTENGRTADRSNLVGPVAEFDHADGYCAIIGGPVLRRSSVPSLEGGYLFTDSCRGELGVVQGDTVSLHPEATLTSPTTFGVSPQRRVYVATQDGDVFLVGEAD